MTLDAALTALLGLVGDRVDVAIESPAGGLIAHFSGELAQGHELSADETAESAPLFFSFEDGSSGFVVATDAVAKARASTDGSSVRISDRAGVTIVVERASSLRDD